jgi:peptidoglycan/xylan/chitin deacetylase (PgdA/CDA1 family)
MQSLISLTFDDGLQCHFDHAVPTLKRYDFPATFFLTANSDEIHTDGIADAKYGLKWHKTTWNEKDVAILKGMIQEGHEIGAHSVHHRHPFLDKYPKQEAEDSKAWIESLLPIKVSSYCYPFCHYTPPIREAVIDAGYKQARWGAQRTYSPEQGQMDCYKIDCRHVGIDNPASVVVNGFSHNIGRDGSENVSGWLQPGWYVVMFHGIGSIHDGWWPVSVAEFARQMAELARLRDSGAVEVVTFKEGADRLPRHIRHMDSPEQLTP